MKIDSSWDEPEEEVVYGSEEMEKSEDAEETEDDLSDSSKDAWKTADKWEADEKIDLAEFIQEMVSIINDRFSGIEKGIKSIKADMAATAMYDSKIANLQEDVSDLRAEIESLKAEVEASREKPSMTFDKSTLKSLKR